MQFRTKAKEQRGLPIDFTPIVDVVFNLMIFFALSLNFITSPGIQVKLPKASAEQFPTEKTEIVIAVTKDGYIFVDQRRISEEELFERLNKMSAQEKEKGLVIVQADEKAFHGKVVEVMDLVKRAGFSRLAIATSPEEKPREG